MFMSLIRKRKLSTVSTMKPRWKGHGYQKSSVAKGFIQKFLAYFLDPGLGKTTIILQLFKMLRLYKKSRGILVIAPIRVCHFVWPLEVKKWSNFCHFKVNVMHGSSKFLSEKADIHVINPDGLSWLMAQLKGRRKTNWPFDMLVIDESTMFKNHNSTRFSLVKKFSKKFNRRYILTGTPIPNGYIQLFSQMQIVDQGFSLGNKIGYYRQEYFKTKGDPRWGVYIPRDEKCVNRINEKIAPFVLRLSAKDYLKLPELFTNEIRVGLPKKVKKYYAELEEDHFLQLNDKEIYSPNSAVTGQKLHQIANGCLYKNWDVVLDGQIPPSKDRDFIFLHAEKIKALEELVGELSGKPLLVGYWYYHDLLSILKAFPKCRVINSSTSVKECADIESKWNKGQIPILLAQPASVAHGLNFQKSGGDVCWYSLIYDFELYDQMVQRVHRQGATRAVTNHHIIAEDTIDEVIYRNVINKSKTQTAFYSILSQYQKYKLDQKTTRHKLDL